MDGLVSVVVPTRDRRARLARALASLRAQTWSRLEIVVVDDGSRDGTAELVTDLAAADDRVRLVRHEHGVGAPAARNAGIDAASGDHLAFLDDDDEWLPAKVERQVAALAARPEAAAATCHHELVVGDRATPFRGPAEVSHGDLLWDNFAGSTSFCLWRRDRVRPEPRFDAAFPSCQDWDVWLQLAQSGPIVAGPDVLARYVAHDEGRITGATDARVAGRERIVAKHGAAMTPACRRYNRARIDLLRAGGPLGELRLAAGLAVRDRATLRLLAETSLAGKLGDRRGDPGRATRTLHRLVGRGS